MNITRIVILIVLVSVTTTSVVAASVLFSLDRENPVPVSPTTENEPILKFEPLEPGFDRNQENVEFAQVANNYTEEVTVTVDFTGADEIEHANGDTIRDISVNPGATQTVLINTGNPGGGCSENLYVYSAESTSFTLFDTTGTTEVCGPAEDPDPPSDDDPEVDLSFDGQVGQSGQRDFSWETIPELDDGSVELQRNGTVIETGLAQTDDIRTEAVEVDDEVTAVLLDADGSQVDSSTVIVSE